MATTKPRTLWQGKQKWKGWMLESPKPRGKGYQILNLTRPKDTPIYSIMASPNVIRIAFKRRGA